MKDGKYSISSNLENRKTVVERTTGVPHHYGLTFVDKIEIVGYVADFSRKRSDEHVIFYSDDVTLHVPKNTIRVLAASDIIIEPSP